MNPKVKPYVVHKNEPHDVYVGRPSMWGNPFKIGKDGSRSDVIRKYVMWLRDRPELLARVPELSNKVLGCHCAPNRCHGEVLSLLANGIYTIDELYQKVT